MENVFFMECVFEFSWRFECWFIGQPQEAAHSDKLRVIPLQIDLHLHRNLPYHPSCLELEDRHHRLNLFYFDGRILA